MAANQYLEAMLGEEEVDWSMTICTLHTIFQSNPRVMGPAMWSEVIDQIVYTWPYTLWERLPWGPEQHLGLQGGLSGWGLDLALDRLDYLVAEVTRLAGRMEWTDLAWRVMAQLGTIHHRCPECGHMGGPQHQMALYGVIDICDTCWGVNWGSGGALY